MQPILSCLHWQLRSHVLKALFFNQNIPKMKLFLQKKAKFSSAMPPAAGGFASKPPASGGWGLRPQTPKQPSPHCEFLATRLGGVVVSARALQPLRSGYMRAN